MSSPFHESNAVVRDLVSTIIPVYNRPRLLLHAVESVLAQTHRAFEIIIVDDGSTDETPEVARSLENQHPNRITFVQKRNTGPGPAREAGRQVACGEFVQYLDSDDRLLPNKFKSQIQVLRSHPDCGIAYGYTRLINEDGQPLVAPFKWTGKDIPFLFPGLLIDRWWCTHTPLYRRTVTDAIGPWCNLWMSEDWEYDARAGAIGVRLVNCKQYVSEHRHHSGLRLTSPDNGTSDPEWLHNRVKLLSALWSNARQAQVYSDLPEYQHFSRWAFAIARQCAAAELINEAKNCLSLAEAAASSGGMSHFDLGAYKWVSQVVGYKIAGQLSQRITQFKNSPSSRTLTQSFATH